MGDALILGLLARELGKRSNLHLGVAGVPSDFTRLIVQLSGSDVRLVESSFWPRVFWATLTNSFLWRRASHQTVHLFLTPGHKRVRSRVRLRKILLVSLLATLRALNCRIARIGFSLELPASTAASLTERFLGNCCSLYSPRDSRSVHLARRIGIRDAVWSPDLATLFAEDPSEVKGLPMKRAVSGSRVGVSLRPASSPSTTGRAVRQILHAYHHDLGVPSVVPFGQVRNDSNYTTSVLQERGILHEDPKDFPVSVEGLFKLVHFYQQMALILTDRLHVALMAMAQGCRTVALIGADDSPKLLDALSSLNIDAAWYFSYDEQGYAGPGTVVEWFSTMWQLDPEISNKQLSSAGQDSKQILQRYFGRHARE